MNSNSSKYYDQTKYIFIMPNKRKKIDIAKMINGSNIHYMGFGQQELLKSHGLTESESGTPSDGDRGRRRERLTERKKLHQLKRDHERQEGTKRKVLRMDEGQEDGFSSGSDTEEAGRSKKRKQKPEQDVDIQVNLIETAV